MGAGSDTESWCNRPSGARSSAVDSPLTRAAFTHWATLSTNLSNASEQGGRVGDPARMDTMVDLQQRIRRLREKLLYRRHLVCDGMSDGRLRAAVAQRDLVRVLHGSFMPRSAWEGLREEDRLLVRTLAHAHMHPDSGAVYSHHSAAVVWRLPLYANRDERVHVLTRLSSRGRSSASVIRHALEYDEDEIVEIAGLRVTNITRTLLDIARQSSVELSVACADAGLRMLFGASRVGGSPVSEWRGAQLERLDAWRSRPGVARARRVIAFADPRADSVAESVSRLQFARLRLEVEIQVRVVGPRGRAYRLDFEFPGQRAFGEVDGAVKYESPEFLRGRTPLQALLDEKEREDQVRGVTGNRIVRWMPREAATARRLGERMLAFGLRVPALE